MTIFLLNASSVILRANKRTRTTAGAAGNSKVKNTLYQARQEGGEGRKMSFPWALRRLVAPPWLRNMKYIIVLHSKKKQNLKFFPQTLPHQGTCENAFSCALLWLSTSRRCASTRDSVGPVCLCAIVLNVDGVSADGETTTARSVRRNATQPHRSAEKTTSTPRRDVESQSAVWPAIGRRRSTSLTPTPSNSPPSFPPTPPPNPLQSTPPVEYFARLSSPGLRRWTSADRQLYTGLELTSSLRGVVRPAYTTAGGRSAQPPRRWTTSSPRHQVITSPWLTRPVVAPRTTSFASPGHTTRQPPIFWLTSAPLTIAGGEVVHCHVQVRV